MQIRKIESRDNPKLKLARRARDGREHQLIFVEGLRLSDEALNSNVSVSCCILRDDFGEDPREQVLLNNLLKSSVDIIEVPDTAFSTLADTRSSQGIILICDRPKTDKRKFELAIRERRAALPLVVFLFDINIPSNLGAVVRSAEAAGAAGVITSSNSADALSPKALRAAMGSSYRVPIWAGASADEVCEWSRMNGKVITAASGSGTVRHTEIDWGLTRLLVMGSEAHGLSQDLLEKADERIRIDMEPAVESLNVAVAAGVILFEARRQLIGLA